MKAESKGPFDNILLISATRDTPAPSDARQTPLDSECAGAGGESGVCVSSLTQPLE